MMLAAVCFASLNAILRLLTAGIPPLELVFFRNFAGLVFMLPWLFRHGLSGLKTDHHGLYFSRSFLGFLSMMMWFTALAAMPLAEATALSFTSPLFATIAAVLVLGEVVRVRRWSATLIGFLGAMIVLRPGIDSLYFAHLLVLGSSAIGGFNAVLVKQLTRTEPANAIVTYMTLYIMPISLIPALFVWVWPPLWTLPWMLVMGLVATIGHQATTRAFATVDASSLTPFDFARLPVSALLAYLAFGEVPDRFVWLGAAVIVAASAYIAHRESQLYREARQSKPPPVAPAATSETAAVHTTSPRANIRRAEAERKAGG